MKAPPIVNLSKLGNFMVRTGLTSRPMTVIHLRPIITLLQVDLLGLVYIFLHQLVEHGSPPTERRRVSVSTFASEVRLEFMPSGIPAVADPFQVTQG